MDILAGLKEKLRFIECFYEQAAAPFRETVRKIEEQEPPFVPRPFDPERDSDLEPPFFTEWEDAVESINLLGQAALTLVQSALKEYLEAYVLWKQRSGGLPVGKGSWFERYRQFFLKEYGIDWTQGPIPPDQLEEINLARNDIQHSGEEFGMGRRQTAEHQRRFPDGVFTDEANKARLAFQPRIHVNERSLSEAIRRVEVFCEYLDG